MTTYKPFSSTELLSAIHIDSEGNLFHLEDQVTEQGLLTLCKNFLTIHTQSNVWRFPHLSVIEYLEAKEGWSRSKAHYQVARTCLSYLITTYDRDFPELPLQTFDLDTDTAVRDEDIVDADKEIEPTELEESDHCFGKYHPFHIYVSNVGCTIPAKLRIQRRRHWRIF
ncbi:hypothetical protein PENSUB_5677 [Penicillium subrubescens]|uniref:Uncharacterized protein n=1 Tax=Penicillium subrubescens TaxID=1316194 RepID=A0A1Q5U756_9EURO|nr:hypothetical protein PENSUB_5677 [Penicillium subrubescens]